jgi:hypothetical protein
MQGNDACVSKCAEHSSLPQDFDGHTLVRIRVASGVVGVFNIDSFNHDISAGSTVVCFNDQDSQPSRNPNKLRNPAQIFRFNVTVLFSKSGEIRSAHLYIENKPI